MRFCPYCGCRYAPEGTQCEYCPEPNAAGILKDAWISAGGVTGFAAGVLVTIVPTVLIAALAGGPAGPRATLFLGGLLIACYAGVFGMLLSGFAGMVVGLVGRWVEAPANRVVIGLFAGGGMGCGLTVMVSAERTALASGASLGLLVAAITGVVAERRLRKLRR